MATKSKSPAFQFYAMDWLSDEHVRIMTLEETGAYIDALAICWREGSIPADANLLARLIGKGCSIEVATCVQRRFNIRCASECNSVERLQHKRLNEERAKQEARAIQQSKAGKLSAEKKAEAKAAKRVGKRVNTRSTHDQHPNNSSSSSSDEDGKEKTASDEACIFPESLRTTSFIGAFNEWKAYRKECRKPMTPRAIGMALKRLGDWGADRAIAAIEFSIANSYQGIFEPGPDGRSQKQDLFAGLRQAAAERGFDEAGH